MDHVTALQRENAQISTEHTHVGEHISQLIWVFLIMSVIGLAGETIQHYLVFNEWESRPGFIWGPLSPIYGTAAVLITVILEPFQKKNPLFLIVIGAIIGGGLEYFASWAMETFWGVVAWSYLNVPFNIDGRTDLFHALMWGMLATLWIKVGLPLFQDAFDRINLKGRIYRLATAALSLFLALDIVMTICVLLRADARSNDIPAESAFEQYLDTTYPTSMLQNRFQNMGGLGIGD